MAKNLTETKIMQALDWAYEKSVNGTPGLDSAFELAEDYMKWNSSRVDKVKSLIRWQNTKAGISGFLSDSWKVFPQIAAILHREPSARITKELLVDRL